MVHGLHRFITSEGASSDRFNRFRSKLQLLGLGFHCDAGVLSRSDDQLIDDQASFSRIFRPSKKTYPKARSHVRSLCAKWE